VHAVDQGLTLVHYSAGHEHFLCRTMGSFTEFQ
jgi:hypothetical protein